MAPRGTTPGFHPASSEGRGRPGAQEVRVGPRGASRSLLWASGAGADREEGVDQRAEAGKLMACFCFYYYCFRFVILSAADQEEGVDQHVEPCKLTAYYY